MTTPNTLLRDLDYNPETGIFTWKTSKWKCGGKRAGCINSAGYVVIRVDNKLHYGHRLAWLSLHGEWPSQEIDHINGDPGDNRANNLRLATSLQNKVNNIRSSRSGFRGVQKHHRKFMAKIKINGKQTYLGLFNSAEEAHSAYMKVAKEHFGEFAGRGAAF